MDIDEHSYNYEQLDKLLYKFLSSRKKYKNTPPKDSLISPKFEFSKLTVI